MVHGLELLEVELGRIQQDYHNKCVYKCKRGRYSNVVTTLNQVLGQGNMKQ
jgi:hypothetical protein